MTPTEGQTTTPSGARHLTDEQVLTLNERHGWFQYRDAQSDVSRQFAHDAIEMYLQAKRDAVTVSPNAAASVDVLGVLTRHVNDLHEGIRYGESINDMDEVVAAVAALIARNAELEAQTPSALREKLRSCEEALRAVEADRGALVAERDALRPNAERYLWLRYRTGGCKVQWGTEFHFPGIKTLPAGLPDWPAACNVGEYLDAAIDRARS